MTLTTTLIVMAALAGIAIFSGWRGAKPPNLLKGPRLVPHRLIMVTASAALLVMTVHLVNLLGVTTGR